MPTTLKLLLYTTAASVILFGFCVIPTQPAAQPAATKHQQSAAQRWVVASMVALQRQPEAQQRSDRYEACAREVRADYADDPEQAYAWIRTLCHY
jgi:hypothetical protein